MMMEQLRITPDHIKELTFSEIFVFGSNESGRHGKGAAKIAMQWGAIYGLAYGLQGRTYAIPTVDKKIRNKLPLSQIGFYVHNFIVFAKNNPFMKFLVTEIGCGLAGWKVKDIAPLFIDAKDVENISLPLRFWEVLTNDKSMDQ